MSLQEHRRNSEIRAARVRLIDAEGEMMGIHTKPEAQQMAEELGLDLVEIQPTADPPVCRIMDYGKFRFDQQKKANLAKKKQKIIEIKEVQFRPVIDQHDYHTKLDHVRAFLDEGNKVRLVVRLKGRERSNPELGRSMIQRLMADLQAVAQFDARGTGGREDTAQMMVLASPTLKTGAKPKGEAAPAA